MLQDLRGHIVARTARGTQSIGLGSLTRDLSDTVSHMEDRSAQRWCCSADRLLRHAASPDDGAIAVVATTTQVGSIAAEVGGDAIELIVLLKPGIEAHDFEITPAAGAAIEQATLILKSGAGLETWLDDAIETIGGEDRVRDLSEGVDLRTSEDGEVDPHYWMSAPNAIVMVENARDALIEAAPAAADGIGERADVLIGRLEAADRRDPGAHRRDPGRSA